VLLLLLADSRLQPTIIAPADNATTTPHDTMPNVLV
jgi:hypothetical protein